MTNCKALFQVLVLAAGSGACVEATPVERAERDGTAHDAMTVQEHTDRDVLDAAATEQGARADAAVPADATSNDPPRGDAAASAAPADVEAGAAPIAASTDAATPTLQRVSLTRNFCTQPGTFASATIDPTNQGGTRFAGDLALPCETGECPREAVAPRELTAAEVARLGAVLAALPAGECKLGPSPVCDPCLVQDLMIGDRTFYVDPCVPLCPGFAAPIGRLLTLIDDLAVTNPRADTEDCYSPTHNLTHAYDRGARGCACDWQEQGVCVAGSALVCGRPLNGDIDLARWQAVFDGPCWQPADCAPAEEVETLEACLRQSTLCVGPREGAFCTF